MINRIDWEDFSEKQKQKVLSILSNGSELLTAYILEDEYLFSWKRNKYSYIVVEWANNNKTYRTKISAHCGR